MDPSISGAGSWGGHADTSENGILAAYRLDYDSADRLEAFDSFADDLRVRYAYDARDQLTGQTYLAGDATVAAGNDVAHTLLASSNQSLSYDDNGNRENSPGVSQSGDGLNNEIASDGTYSYLYDGEGNITKRTVIATGDYREFDWDYRNRLTGVRDYTSAGALVREVENHYDLNNRWIAQRVDNNANGSFDDVGDRLRQFVQDGSQIALEFENNKLTGRYLWAMGVDQLLAEEDVPSDSTVSGDIRWALADHLGSVRDLAATDSTIVDHAIYDAFGNTIDNPSDGGEAAIDSLFGYTARPIDEETGLQNNLNRWYDSENGRWLSQDPIGFAAGDANLYRYVGNGVTTKTDPRGLEEDEPIYVPIPPGGNSRDPRTDPAAAAEAMQPKPRVTYFPSVFGGSFYLNDSYFAGHPFGIPTIVCHGRNGTGRYGPGNSFRFPGGPGVLQMAQGYRDTAGILGLTAGAIGGAGALAPASALPGVGSTAVLPAGWTGGAGMRPAIYVNGRVYVHYMHAEAQVMSGCSVTSGQLSGFATITKEGVVKAVHWLIVP